MSQTIKRSVTFLFVLLTILTGLASIFLFGWIGGSFVDTSVRNKIFEHVQNNKDTIKLEDPNRYQEFFIVLQDFKTVV